LDVAAETVSVSREWIGKCGQNWKKDRNNIVIIIIDIFFNLSPRNHFGYMENYTLKQRRQTNCFVSDREENARNYINLLIINFIPFRIDKSNN
jgi:hypothetical protein